MVLEVRLAQEHTVAVLMWTAELLRLLLVDLRVLCQLLLAGKCLAASLEWEQTEEDVSDKLV